MAIVNNAAPAVVAPAVALPATGIDPTAAAPALSAHDAALVAEVQATIAARAAAPVVAADPTGAVAVPAAQEAVQAAPAVEVAQPQPEAVAAAPAVAPQAGATPEVNTGNNAAAPTGEAAPVELTPSQKIAAVELTPSQKIAAKIEGKRAQIVKLTAEIEKLEAQYRSADLLDNVKAGSIIVARVGRAETAREVQASVIGVQTLDNGDRRLKIYFGEGFDAETVVIQDSQIIDIQQV